MPRNWIMRCAGIAAALSIAGSAGVAAAAPASHPRTQRSSCTRHRPARSCHKSSPKRVVARTANFRRRRRPRPVPVPIVTTPTPTTTTPTTTTPTPTPVPVANSFGSGMFGIAAGGAMQSESGPQLTSDLAIDQSLGSRWIRIDINWAQVQAGGPTSYDWTAVDAVVRGAEADGMSVLGVIVYTPSWARPAGTSATYGPSGSSYAGFAGAAAAHYRSIGVHAYEIWNEENAVASWTPAHSPTAYAGLLKAAYPAIHAADPSATVVTGGLSPEVSDGFDIAPTDFLAGVYGSGAGGYFDAVGAHPYCWPAQPGDPQGWSAWYQMYGTSISMRSLMVANGDGAKKIWATEFGAPTGGPSGSFVSQAQQAQAITNAYQLWSSYSWGGPLFVFQGRDQGTDSSSVENFFGMASYAGTPKPAYAAFHQAVTSI
jgi:hypothetical protein